MLVKLLSLYKKESKSERTPLEDFITEVFAEILRKDDTVLKAFVRFLELPEDEYSVSTQKKYAFEEKPCIVDLVLQGRESNTICFFESKINSLEGIDQLNRYSLLLARLLDNQNTPPAKGILVYCTKHLDQKTEPQEVSRNKALKFTQKRWQNIYDLLASHANAPYVTDLLELLKLQKMNQRLVLTSEDLNVFTNLQDTIGLLKEYLLVSRNDFVSAFGDKSKQLSDGLTVGTILEQNKVFYRFNHILKGEVWSDLKYGFDFESNQIFVNIWSDNRHPLLHLAEDEARILQLGVRDSGNGIEIYLERTLEDLIDSTHAQGTVKDWFNTSFVRFSDLLAQIKEDDGIAEAFRN